MGNRLQTMGWEFDREELCFNCRSRVAQRIKVMNGELLTQCTDCGAEAHYARDDEKKTPGDTMDAWRIRQEARCPQCGEGTTNEMLIAPAAAKIACEKCRFTRLYRFDAFDQCWRR
jgi:DNA-directed RNA polymerase subunit RPC12/RpoP